MGTEVIMPQLGESVVEGTVMKWLRGEGDHVEEFEALLEVNTDKVDTEIPSPASGDVLKVYIEEGQTVRAGTILAYIGTPGEEIPLAPAGEPSVVGMTTPTIPTAVSPPPQASSTPPVAAPRSDLGFLSPVVMRIAAEHNIDLNRVPGTGRGGRITKKDVLGYLEARDAGTGPQAPWEEPASGELFRPTEELFGARGGGTESGWVPGETVPLDPVRKSIADHMLRSVQTSPHVSTIMEADLSKVIAHRKANTGIFAREGVKLTLSAYFVAASVQALKVVPIVNSSWGEDGILLHQPINIGLAVSLGEKGLIVPVIRNADQLSLLAIARAINDLARRARAGELKPDEVQGGTFTITNHGVSGSLFATPIIHQPQAAILGVGAIQKRVVVVDAQLPSGEEGEFFAIRPMVYLGLTFDHRMLDGAVGDTFLGHIVNTLENWGPASI